MCVECVCVCVFACGVCVCVHACVHVCVCAPCFYYTYVHELIVSVLPNPLIMSVCGFSSTFLYSHRERHPLIMARLALWQLAIQAGLSWKLQLLLVKLVR